MVKQIVLKKLIIFASKYKDLYNSVPTKQDLIEDIERYIKGAAECVSGLAVITREIIEAAIVNSSWGKRWTQRFHF